MDDFDREWLTDMLDYAKTAIRVLGSRDVAELNADETVFLAVSHAIQNVGEAANHVSPQEQALLSDIPWRDVIGMRHRLVHGYRSRSATVIVGTVRDSLPSLIVVLERALGEEAR